MKSLLFVSLSVLMMMTGCADRFEKHESLPPFPPASPEQKARDYFFQSGVVQEYRANGIQLDCGDACIHVTDEQINLLKSYVKGFAGIQKKIAYIRLSANERIRFTHPVGTYVLYLPWNVKSDQIDEALLLFKHLFYLEQITGYDIYVSSTAPQFLKAIEVLIQSVDEVRSLNLQEIYVSNGTTNYSKSRRSTEMNADDLRSSFAKVKSRIELFVEADRKMPGIEFGITQNNQANYDFLKNLIQHSTLINEMIGSDRFHLQIATERDDIYFSGYSLGRHWVGIHSTMSLKDLSKVLSYEVYLANLSRRLGVRVVHAEGASLYSQFLDCQTKLPYLENALLQKASKLKWVLIDYDVMERHLPSRMREEGVLMLVCGTESVDQMLAVINGIETPSPPR